MDHPPEDRAATQTGPTDDGWPARLDELLAGARRRRAERQRIRAEHAAARTAGLKARHAAKLARTAQPVEEDDRA